MKPGQPSRTAAWVCAGRAVAHGRKEPPPFDDATAIVLLPEDMRKRVERIRAGRPRGLRDKVRARHLGHLARFMVVRTLGIDRAIEDNDAEQLVILGAGLDGRAWRMETLREKVVFEVDHPDSQRVKKERIGSLAQRAKDVRFVAVDFEKDSLDEALEDAGHDPKKRTTWVWEGVVMYLDLPAIEATLSVVRRRSASGSRIIVLYHYAGIFRRFIGLAVKAMGEPLKSQFRPEQMQALLARYGLSVVWDKGMGDLGREMNPELGKAMRHMRHLRLVVADQA